jgi:hypothetical protein
MMKCNDPDCSYTRRVRTEITLSNTRAILEALNDAGLEFQPVVKCMHLDGMKFSAAGGEDTTCISTSDAGDRTTAD